MSRADETNKRLRESILDLLCFCATYSITLTAEEIVAYIPHKASLVGVKTHLNLLIKRGKLRQFKNQRYGIKKTIYSKSVNSLQPAVSKAVLRFARLLRVIPFVKAVVLSADTVFGGKKPNLIIVTTPNRIYLTKDILTKLQKNFGKNKPLGDIDCNIFYTTAGIRFDNHMMATKAQIALWYVCGKPLMGQKTWFGLLKNSKQIYTSLPNYQWPRQDVRIQTSSNKQLDLLDNKRYRFYLKQMSQAKDFQKPSSLLRVRPDVFIARKLHNSNLQNNQEKFLQIRKSV